MEDIDINYKILYEDDLLLAVDKSGNCPVHPGGIRFKNNSLLTQLEKDLNCNNNSSEGNHIKLYPVYRIDRETSGIVVFAKNNSVIKDLKIENKIYLAICKGEVEEQHINLPISKIRGDYIDWKYGVDENGKHCQTFIKPIKSNKKYSLVEVKLFTGRQHQIRVHLQAIGHSIIGDKIYGESDKIFKDYVEDKLILPYNEEKIERQALHMHSIEINGRKIFSELPDDLRQILKKINL